MPFKLIYSEKATKFCKIFTLLLSHVVPIKSKVKISQNFVAFSEYMTFITALHAFSKTEFPASLQLGFHPCFLTAIARSMPITIDCIHSSIKEFGIVPNPNSYTFNKLQFYLKNCFYVFCQFLSKNRCQGWF